VENVSKGLSLPTPAVAMIGPLSAWLPDEGLTWLLDEGLPFGLRGEPVSAADATTSIVKGKSRRIAIS
jgi:hypothetical protein